MTKVNKKVFLVIIALALLIAVLVGCNTYKFTPLTGDVASASSESNSGSVVKHGEYYYFINGKVAYDAITETSHNKYGNVTKGALYRAKKDADGKFTDIQVVVPKLTMTQNYNQGISIYGGYIYYASPSVATDAKGNLQTSYTEYYRCNLDGTNTKMIVRVEGATTEYKFTSGGLYYYKENVLKFIPTSDSKIGREVEVAKDVTSAFFPASDIYTVGEINASDCVFYTKANDNKDGSINNYLYAAKPDGSVATLINEDESKAETKYSRAIKSVVVEGKDVAIYYERSVKLNGATVNEGLFGYKFDSTLKFSGTEKRFTNATGKTYYPISFDAGMLFLENNKLMSYTVAADGKLENVKSIELPTGVTPTVFKIRDGYIYYTASNALLRFAYNIGDDNISVGMSQVVIKEYLTTDWYPAEFIGNEIFYINSHYLNYMYYGIVSDDQIVGKDSGITTSFVGVMTEDDKESYDEMLEEEAKEK